MADLKKMSWLCQEQYAKLHYEYDGYYVWMNSSIQTHSSRKEAYVNNALNSNPSKYEQDDDAVS
jgi:hypothetical protein